MNLSTNARLMADSSQLQPELPQILRDAAFRGLLVPFIGGGVSALVGCPTWEQFADGALRDCVGKTPLTHAQFDQLKTLNPRTKLSIARDIEREHKITIDYKALLHPEQEDKDKGRVLYERLRQLNTKFVTTNYDEWLDGLRPGRVTTVEEPGSTSTTPVWKPDVVFQKSELTADTLNRENVVIHLHGSVREPEGMVLTTSDYVQHYQNDRSGLENPILTFLDNLFRNKHVLFLGYGLDELEILEYIILKSREVMAEDAALRHYTVQGFFSHEHQLMLRLKSYYRQCGVGLIPFLKDENGHDQLLDVIDWFAVQAPAAPLMLAEAFREMEEWLNG